MANPLPPPPAFSYAPSVGSSISPTGHTGESYFSNSLFGYAPPPQNTSPQQLPQVPGQKWATTLPDLGTSSSETTDLNYSGPSSLDYPTPDQSRRTSSNQASSSENDGIEDSFDPMAAESFSSFNDNDTFNDYLDLDFDFGQNQTGQAGSQIDDPNPEIFGTSLSTPGLSSTKTISGQTSHEHTPASNDGL